MRASLLTLGTLALVCAACAPVGAACAPVDEPRALVRFPASEAAAVPVALIAVERAAHAAGAARVRAVGCSDAGAVLLTGAGSADLVAAVHARLSAADAGLPAGAGPTEVRSVSPDLLVLSVRGDDVFAARAYVDAVLEPALRAVPGVHEVQVTGGRMERRLRLDPERLLAADLSIPEVLAAVRLASSLEKAVVKALPGGGAIKLADVATIERAPTGERARKDGGVEVRVRGHHAGARAAREVARTATPPVGTSVHLLDDDSVEVFTVLVGRQGQAPTTPDEARAVAAAVDGAFADVTVAALSVPGVHTYRRGRALSLTLDRERATRRGLSGRDLATLTDVAAVVGSGLRLAAKDGPITVVLAAVTTPEALLRTRVTSARPGQPALRLFDVARATLAEEQRRDRLHGHDARRLRLSFDAGVRQRALDELERRIATVAAARPGVVVSVERDHDTATLDAVCP